MFSVAITEQEKKDLAVIYGFLVDVWAAQQHKAAGSTVLTRGNGNTTKHTKK